MPDALLLESILREERLTPLFQPIIDAGSRDIYGYEALIRGPVGTALHSPLALFDTAARTGHLVELDLLCRRLAIQRFMDLALGGKLFLNVMPTSLVERDFREGLTRAFLDSLGMAPERVVIELTEHTPIHDYDLVRQAVAHYRSMGFKVALDDLGAGHSSLRHWAELRPDFVKVDRHFVKDIDCDPLKRQFMQSLLNVSLSLGCQVIAEGIETTGEYRCLWGLNWPFLQGFYFSHPSESPPGSIAHLLPASRNPKNDTEGSAAMLCRQVSPIELDTPVPKVVERFKAQPDLRCLTVVDEQRPVGVVRQHGFLQLFTNPFSHSLYARRTIGDILDTNMLVTRADTSLETLSQQITESSHFEQQDFVIVDDRQRYLGMGNVIDLLREITTLQVRSARHANPLTGLPGNVLIDETLTRRLVQGRPFAAIYCDMDNFKAYNDAYGYAHGDRVITALARLLQEHSDSESDFVGHVGGDDFMLVMGLEGAQQVCEAILGDFERLAPEFYTPEHRRQGGLRVASRQGHETFFPIVTLSLALQPVTPGSHGNALDIANSLSELKHQAKQRVGNSLFVDRRHGALPALDGRKPEEDITETAG
ncbi:bifunctional diguanylate cyclase/phosphodiesterase [Modicisalibacter radicis]|uniref:bifunctional diguanylate cyclase/phosphodiesterase n=1 Tax=Halomonas sp. EAR18 TaxID=2518972 RepID=UPI00109D1CAD|nr:bifunctional diguanylate cyclase/phosphodiesterase [Halomonas sp. EAR18]